MHESTAATGTSMKLGACHGYRIEGDTALLNAEVAPTARNAHHDAAQAGAGAAHQWALQLWACDRPHAGGPLSGVKVAEARIDLPLAPVQQPHRLNAEAFAHLPVDRKDYAMVLVLASKTSAAFNRVHDFANYPERQPFVAPHMQGPTSYAIEGHEVVLRAARIVNPRATGNLSGSLALELRALANPGSPDDLSGPVVAHVGLGRLGGQGTLDDLELRATGATPATVGASLAMVLVEFSAEGFVARDSHRFPVVAAPEPALKSTPVVEAPAAGPTLVSIQTASIDELAAVPGITRKLAIEIVKARPFRTVDELVKTRGVGDKLLRKIRERLTV